MGWISVAAKDHSVIRGPPPSERAKPGRNGTGSGRDIRSKTGWCRRSTSRTRSISASHRRPGWSPASHACRRKYASIATPTASSAATVPFWRWSARCAARRQRFWCKAWAVWCGQDYPGARLSALAGRHGQTGATEKWELGFLINITPYQGGRSAGSLAWAGIFNTFFWIRSDLFATARCAVYQKLS